MPLACCTPEACVPKVAQASVCDFDVATQTRVCATSTPNRKHKPYCSIPTAEPEMISGVSIICFAGEDWWYHHPHSKYHLMRRFARAGNRVIFVNSISMGLPSLRTKTCCRASSVSCGPTQNFLAPPEGVTVVSPAVVPFFGSARRAA